MASKRGSFPTTGTVRVCALLLLLLSIVSCALAQKGNAFGGKVAAAAGKVAGKISGKAGGKAAGKAGGKVGGKSGGKTGGKDPVPGSNPPPLVYNSE